MEDDLVGCVDRGTDLCRNLEDSLLGCAAVGVWSGVDWALNGNKVRREIKRLRFKMFNITFSLRHP